jgi:hypothetical protein
MNLHRPAFLFSFPDGPPGIGLLILRLSLTSGLISFAVVSFRSQQRRTSFEIGADLLVLLASVLLAIGLETHLTGAAVTLAMLFAFTPWAPSFIHQLSSVWTVSIFVIPLAAAIVLLGPGAFSLDAHRFGRKEIVIPPGSTSLGSQ